MKRTHEEDALLNWHKDYLEGERRFMEAAIEDLPMEWFEEEFAIQPEERKTRLTLYVDESVARVFKKHVNWQDIMRGVLRAYVRAKQDKLLKSSKAYRQAWLVHTQNKRALRVERLAERAKL